MPTQRSKASPVLSSPASITSVDDATRIMSEMERIMDEMKHTIEMMKLIMDGDETLSREVLSCDADRDIEPVSAGLMQGG